ncbi:uncharacterized protein LOC123321732 [Coccinella septempunctata]|uniref:uncharacterized protein LOC123321732 n=1 Tax=Coccinella septempunctata TaxID=41139 RepID=UPI001D07A599|nr:uncharacterized protein LOC123321732 [Coccinella septempunctata]
MIAMDSYFSPKTNTVYERYIFRSIKQVQGESMEQFITKLKEQGKNCNYIDLDDQIRDQVIEKCSSSELRRKFLEKGEIKLDEVREIAKAFEATELQMNAMNGNAEVNKVVFRKNKSNTNGKQKISQTDGSSTRRRRCYRCGDTDHLANTCKFVNSFYHFCKNKGHLRKVCFKFKKSNECNEVSDSNQNNIGASEDPREDICEL